MTPKKLKELVSQWLKEQRRLETGRKGGVSAGQCFLAYFTLARTVAHGGNARLGDQSDTRPDLKQDSSEHISQAALGISWLIDDQTLAISM